MIAILAARGGYHQGVVARAFRRLISDMSKPTLDTPASSPEISILDRITALVYEDLLMSVRDGRHRILVAPVQVTIGLNARDQATLAAAGLDDGARLGRTILHLLRKAAVGETVQPPRQGLTVRTEADDAIRPGRPQWRTPVLISRYRRRPVLVAWEDAERAPDRELSLEPGEVVVRRGLLEEIGCRLDDQVSSSRHAVVEIFPDDAVELHPAADYWTYVNEVPIRQPVLLTDHDRLRFGATELTFRHLFTFGPVEPWPTADG